MSYTPISLNYDLAKSEQKPCRTVDTKSYHTTGLLSVLKCIAKSVFNLAKLAFRRKIFLDHLPPNLQHHL